MNSPPSYHESHTHKNLYQKSATLREQEREKRDSRERERERERVVAGNNVRVRNTTIVALVICSLNPRTWNNLNRPHVWNMNPDHSSSCGSKGRQFFIGR
jgi:putative ribosome biogenesis GTPase RsgA